MKVDRVGVHTSHCCKKCGCKYGDSDCPVVLGTREAEYLCEWCEEEKEDLRNSFLRMKITELEETVLHLNELIREKKTKASWRW